MTHAQGRKGKGGAVNPTGPYAAHLDTQRWYPQTISEDGSLRTDVFALGTPGIHKFGANSDISTASVPEDIWDGGGVYPGFIPAAIACEILSNDPNDDAGDTGARTVEVQGLDADGNMQTVVVTMNGVGVVAIGIFFRIFRMIVRTAGASEGNEGTITARTVVGAITMAQILPLNGQTLMAVYTVPNDFDAAFLVQMTTAVRAANAQAVAATMILQVRPSGEAWQIHEDIEVHSYGGLAVLDHRHTPELAALTDIRTRVVGVSGNNIDISGSFDLKFFERIIAD